MTETTSMTKKSKKPSTPKLLPDELIDQLLAQVQNKDAESILGEPGLAGLLKKQGGVPGAGYPRPCPWCSRRHQASFAAPRRDLWEVSAPA